MSMSLDAIRNVVLLFSNPSWKGVGTVSSTVIRNITALQSQMAYSAQFTGNTTVLSTRYATVSTGSLGGLLYVPDLPYGDKCVEETSAHVPGSAVRQSDLPPSNYHLIAIAPWVNDRCASLYLEAARTASVRAFLFYQPDATDSPPAADSPNWYIKDGADWMTETSYPVFAVSGIVGDVMMQHLSLYSGNMTEVPYGRNISDLFLTDNEDYLRIWTQLDISMPPVPFGTWVYFLIILVVLLAVISATSILMHFVQGRRRAQLRRRVLAGEVNLEAMGIKHLTIPMDHIQKFPLFTYHYEPDISSPPLSPQSVRRSRSGTGPRSLDATESAARSQAAPSVTVPEPPAASSSAPTEDQPTCEICLDRYENRVTVIRELPCGHIFHPECIDEFLHEVSSLCPVCKASMLPDGYCPRITNAMVRRERAVRRLRGSIDDQDFADGRGPGRLWGLWPASLNRFFRSHLSPTSIESYELKPVPERRPPQQIRLQLRRDPPGDVNVQEPPAAPARARMRQLAGFEPDYGDGRSSKWQRMRARIFPGF